MAFLSGCAGLVYEILWMRQLGLLLGNTAHAAATTLGVFFAGLAAGSWFWGRRVSAARSPLRLYGGLEVGIAVTALLYLGVRQLFSQLYPVIHQGVGPGVVLLLFKWLLAVALVFPPAFCMGGTIPAMGQYLVARRETFGTTTARLYGINTLGAALGAFIAAFVGVPYLGFRMTFASVLLATVTIAVLAFVLSRQKESGPAAGVAPSGTTGSTSAGKEAPADRDGLGRPVIYTIAFLSGGGVLALEVVWTRVLAQIHENSVYSFSAVLIIVLACLSAGAFLAAQMARVARSARQAMATLLLGGGAILGVSPWLILELTGDLTMLSTDGSFVEYLLGLFGIGFAGIGPPCLLFGMVFPFLMKAEERFAITPGRSIGYVSAVNTVGAILGSVLSGFVLLRSLGMWRTVQSIAAVYLLAAVILPSKAGPAGKTVTIAGSALLLLLLFTMGFSPRHLPAVGSDPRLESARVLDVWEADDCTISVVEHDHGERTIKLNSNYNLGSTRAVASQVFQARIPLFIYPETRRVFFLGMGTGMTAGAALDRGLFPGVEHIAVCELVPEVVEAARQYLTGTGGGPDYTNGLFEDPRAEILITDGRHYLMSAGEAFDMINADLFLPYRSGAGSLYSREHFENVASHLAPGGVFVQWLPLFQMTEYEFGVVSRTMLTVFDQVTLWRNNFYPGRESMALIGHGDGAPIPAAGEGKRVSRAAALQGADWRNLEALHLPCDEQNITLFYCGNMTAARHLFDGYPVNTEDRPVIEYRGPLSLHGQQAAMMPSTLVGPGLADLVDRLFDICPPSTDPMLANRPADACRLPLAGAALHRAWIGYALSDAEMCARAWEDFVEEWTHQDE